MTTTISLDFDAMDDETAATLTSAIEGFVNRQFPRTGLHGGVFTTESAWLPQREKRDNPQILEPTYVEVGDGVTWSYASDCYAGTIVEFSKSQKTIWFTMDDTRRIDQNGPYSEWQEYEYLPNTSGHRYKAMWNSNYQRYYIVGTRYGISPGRRYYQSPSV